MGSATAGSPIVVKVLDSVHVVLLCAWMFSMVTRVFRTMSSVFADSWVWCLVVDLEQLSRTVRISDRGIVARVSTFYS